MVNPGSGYYYYLVSEKHEKYAEKVLNSLENHEIRALLDVRNETVGKKIREAEVNKIPYMIIIGEKEESEEVISVRRHGEGDLGTFTIEEFSSLINKEIKSTLQQF